MRAAFTNDLLEIYYAGLAGNGGWESSISADFTFIGGNGAVTKGKDAYIQVAKRFCLVFKDVVAKQTIIQGEDACVIANYRLVSPSGKEMTLDIAEVWNVKDEKLSSLVIYFDTATWTAFMAG